MSVLPILIWPDPRLSEVCAPVGEIGENIRSLADDMLETMYDAQGRGLAAPQVGVLARLFVMDASWKDGVRAPSVCIDPKILETSDETTGVEEGCLSIPGIATEVMRPAALRLAWTTLEGERVIARLDGAQARIAFHEIDHLDGVVTLDRLSPKARAEAEAQYASA